MVVIKKTLPNSTLVLVLGILSILGCWLYGFIGVILAIVALVMSKNSMAIYALAPEEYEGYGNLQAGRIMAIIGLVVSGLVFLFFVIVFALIGGAVFSLSALSDYL